MYDFKTPEYEAYVEVRLAMTEKLANGGVVSAAEQLTVQVAFSNAEIAATEV